MSVHRRRDYDLDEVMSKVHIEPDAAFEARLRARLRQKLGADQLSTLWSNGRRPLPNSQRKRGASLADEEERPMRSSRWLTMFAFGLTAVVIAVLVGMFALPRGGPDQPSASTEEQTAAPQDEATPAPVEAAQSPTGEPPQSPTPLPGETAVTDLSVLIGVWRGYYAAGGIVIYKEILADGSVVYGPRVEGSGDEIHVLPYQGSDECVNCTTTFDGSEWQLRGYSAGEDNRTYRDAIGRYEIRMGAAEDGSVQHRFVEIEDAYEGRADLVINASPWVRIDLQPGERIVSDRSDLVGVWRGYYGGTTSTMYLHIPADGGAQFGTRVEGSGDQLRVIPDESNECVSCTSLFGGSAFRVRGGAAQDKDNPGYNAVGYYEMRLLTGEDGSVQLRYFVIDDPYQRRVDFYTAFQPWVRVDLQPGERIVADLAELAGVWKLDHPDGALYMQVDAHDLGWYGSLVIGGAVEGAGEETHVVPTERVPGVDEPQFKVTSDISLPESLFGVADTGGVWFDLDAGGDPTRARVGRYEVRLLENGDGLMELRFVAVNDPYQRRTWLSGYGAWTRVSP